MIEVQVQIPNYYSHLNIQIYISNGHFDSISILGSATAISGSRALR